MTVNVSFNTSGFSELAVRLREVAASFPIMEEKAITAGAEVVREEALSRTSSDKVKTTLRVVPLPPIGGNIAVAIGAGESGSGNAGLLPLLLEGGSGTRKFVAWEHPVYGNTSILVTQMAKPYLAPALADKEEEMVETISYEINLELDEELTEDFGG